VNRWLILAAAFLAASCASHRPLEPSPQIQFFLLDALADPPMLRAPNKDGSQDQLVTATCSLQNPLPQHKDLCYVIEGERYKALRKSIVDLEESLRACQTLE
jgi:uncharacterized lipoprotein YmbA